ncbi:alkaline phosphatase D family protein [Emcibacter sp.]|uniref:alkaline phosphatase D family protein n=1 Tax=Emcibacter sp. TaxID=1979954 RepID=UPI003A95BDA8
MQISRRQFHRCAASLLAAGTFSSLPLQALALPERNVSGQQLNLIAFGSCAQQEQEQPIWDKISALDPDLFVFLGDTVYANTEIADKMAGDYDLLARQDTFRAFREKTRMIGIWDDHDYGTNDGGKNYVMKKQAKQIFLDFFDEPRDSERRTRDGGIYTSYLFGPKGRRIHIILPDLRYERDDTPYDFSTDSYHQQHRNVAGLGPFLPNLDPSARIMSDTQWKWLEEELKVPAELKIIGSGIQFVAATSGWEGWAQFPHERTRLIRLIEKTRTDGVLFISGDIHRGEFSMLPVASREKAPYPIWDFSSSGLQAKMYPGINPNRFRFNNMYYDQANFGLIQIDWNLPDPQITAEIRNANGEMVLQHTIALGDLRGGWHRVAAE